MTALSQKAKKLIMEAFDYFDDDLILDDTLYVVVRHEQYKKIMTAKRILKRAFEKKRKEEQ